MILGIGTDLIDIRRIEQLLGKFETRFYVRILTETEQKEASYKKDRAPFIAKRFAAKEACLKALGTGLAHGLSFQDIEVRTLPTGAPTLTLSGKAVQRLASLCPSGETPRLHLSLTDEPPYAQAFVILESC